MPPVASGEGIRKRRRTDGVPKAPPKGPKQPKLNAGPSVPPPPRPLALLTKKQRKNILRKGLPYTPAAAPTADPEGPADIVVPPPVRPVERPTPPPKAKDENTEPPSDERLQGVRVQWDPCAMLKATIDPLYPEIQEVSLLPTFGGATLRFTENKHARQAFVRDEEELYGLPVSVDPSNKESQDKGFQGFLLCPVMKLLTAIIRKQAPEVRRLVHLNAKTVVLLVDPETADTIRGAGGIDVLGQRLTIAVSKPAPPARPYLTLRCNAPEVAFRVLRRVFPKVSGIKFHPKGTCGVAVFHSPEEAQAALVRGTDTVVGVPITWRNSGSHIPTEAFILFDSRKVLQSVVQTELRTEVKLKQQQGEEAEDHWRVMFKDLEAYQRALRRRRVELRDYGLMLPFLEAPAVPSQY